MGIKKPKTKRATPKRKSEAGKVGRPTELNAAVRNKIEHAAALGASVEEIAYYCGVHRVTLFRWMAADEELRNRIEELQQRPILEARQTIYNSLKSNPATAQWFLERKRKDEFSTRQEVTGKNGEPLLPERKNAIIKALKGIL